MTGWQHLRTAYHTIRNTAGITVLQVSPVYISDALLPENAPAEWDLPYFNLALRCETTLEPLALLKAIKNVELLCGRNVNSVRWGPRDIDIDILAWEELVIQQDSLNIPHKSLQERPFALWPLSDVAPSWRFPLAGNHHGKTAAEIVEAWGSRFTGDAPFHTRQINQRVDTPKLVGVINVTPDSFSDGGRFCNIDSAVAQASQLVNAGAEILDLGAESTAPSATAISPEIEWQRLEPVLSAINAAKKSFLLTPVISIDTRHPYVAAQALLAGVDWINDVTGLQDPAMRDIIAQSKVDCVVMHHVSIPASRAHVLPRGQDVVKMIFDWGKERLELLDKSGISRDRIIFDPGIGFGKVPEHSLALIKHASVFSQLGVRVLVGHSRKSFLSLFTSQLAADRDVETMIISMYLGKQHGVDYLRLHNIEMTARGFRVVGALRDM